MGVVVHIDRFSGPMALLLHLIRREEMDIFDINIHQITQQYLDTIKTMKKLNLEVAGDFIAMAATLIQIKSKMLLPQYNENGEVMEQEDPRKDLVQRLVEYQMYQEAGHALYKLPLLGRNVFGRGEKEDIPELEEEIVVEEENALYSLIAAYRLAVKNMKKVVHRVGESLQSIADRVWELRDRLIVGRPARFFELIDEQGPARKGQLLITFLSLLELAKIGIVSLFQSENFEDIHIETKRELTREAISQVENYDAHAAAATGPVTMVALDQEPESATGQLNLTEASVSGPVNEATSGDTTAVEEVNDEAILSGENEAPVEMSVVARPMTAEAPIIESATDEEIELELARLDAIDAGTGNDIDQGSQL